MKKSIAMLCTASLLFSFCLLFTGSKEMPFDENLPSLREEDGWVQTLNTDFSQYSSMEEIYKNTPWSSDGSHGKRKTEYWCDQALHTDAKEGALVIASTREENHDCPICNQKSGIFTGCLETRKTDSSEGFAQAFGYYEVVCKVPDAPGMWSAFWLQCGGTGKVGNQGKDGTEIDVFESSFHQKNRTQTGNALHYDAYDSPWYRCVDHVTDVGYDLYDGQYHKYALHWSPDAYVFFVDDKPIWATNAGGVSCVPEFLRLTVEIRDNKVGPYGQQLGTFENRTDSSTDFAIKSVKVWQKDSYKPFIQSESNFKNKKKLYKNSLLAAEIIGGVLAVSGITGIIAAAKKKKSKKETV